MKYLSLLIIFCMSSAMACDFSTEIKQVEGGYLYSKSAHLCVGKMVKDLEDREQQVALLNKSVELKDLALVTTEKRVELWQTTAYKLEDRVMTMEKFSTAQTYLSFGLGVAVTALSVWAAGQLK
jgi:lysozyme family protein